MSCTEIHKGDVGTVFTVTVENCNSQEDLSAATLKQILFKKPSGTLLTKTASFSTDGTDGILTYTTIAGDLDEVGTWKIQAYLEFASGSYHTEYTSFKVERNLE